MGSTFGAGLCWGLLGGFLLGWLMDLVFWRRRHRPADTGAVNHVNFAAPAASTAQAAASGVTGAMPAGASALRSDDLEAVEGIGPKIAGLLRGAGVTTFAQLAETPTEKLQAILDAGGPHFKLAKPATWAEQAALAAKGDWAAFDKLKKELVAGVRSTNA